MHRPSSLSLLAVLGASACDPVYSVHGTVVDASGVPVTGASITMVCPSGRTEVATSGATGDFDFGGVGGSFEAPRCSLRIEKPGLATQTVATTAVCFRSSGTGNAGKPCRPGEGRVVLAP